MNTTLLLFLVSSILFIFGCVVIIVAGLYVLAMLFNMIYRIIYEVYHGIRKR